MFTDVLSVVAALSIMLRCSISIGMMHCHYASALSSHPSASSAAIIQSVGQSSRLNNALITFSSRRTASARPFCRSSSLLVRVDNNGDDASDIIKQNQFHFDIDDDDTTHQYHHGTACVGCGTSRYSESPFEFFGNLQ